MKIGPVELASPFVVAPMAGMTDSAFRRLVKRHGGCGLVVTEMVSSEGLVRGIDRTLEYAEYTEEERPVSIQIFGGDPEKMAAAAQIVEGMGADIVDVNMGCPVPKIAKHSAGCSLMKEPEHAAGIIRAMARAVHIPVTVKMRAGWNDRSRNAVDVARRVEDAGASAVTIHGRTAEQSYSGTADWELVSQVIDRLGSRVSGVLVGRGVLRNPWILAQAADLRDGGRARTVTLAERGRFLHEYIELLLNERLNEKDGFRHVAPGTEKRLGPGAWGLGPGAAREARGHDRWVINKIRALCSWYSKGLDGGSHLRARVNGAITLAELRAIVEAFFFATSDPIPRNSGAVATAPIG
jgi:tRNA-dihydrouridine synthase B